MPNQNFDPTSLASAPVGVTPTASPLDSGAYSARLYSYGQYAGGAADWTKYYQGLANTLSSQYGQQGSTIRSSLEGYGRDQAGLSATQAANARAAATAAGGRGASLSDAAAAEQARASYYAGQGLSGLANVASGAVSPAAIAASQANSQAMHQQLAAAASTRGPAAVQAAAQQAAGQQAAQLQAQNVSTTAAAQAQERLAANQALTGAASGMYGAAGSQALGGSGQVLQAQGQGEQQALAATGQGLQANLGFSQLGMQQGLSYDTLAAQSRQAYENMGAGIQGEQLQAGIAARGQDLGIQGTNAQIAAQQQSQAIGAGLAAGGALVALASDERLKTDVEPQGGGPTKDHLLSALAQMRAGKRGGSGGDSAKEAPVADGLLETLAKSKATFAYKDPADQPVSPMHPREPGARFGGVMAQDLEKAPEIGRQLVTDTPRGKVLEPQATLSAALMAIGRLEEKVEALGGKGGARARSR